MVRKIYVDSFLKQLGQGVSEPALVIGSDQQRYVLKNQRVIEDGKLEIYDSMFLNELLAYQIAVYLEVPVPESAIAILEKQILDNGPSLRFVHRFQEGAHFASVELKGNEENLIENYEELSRMGKPFMNKTWSAFFSNIVNKDAIPKIIAFDVFIANFDRYNNTGNLLVANDLERKLYSIDHGHAFFGPKWDTQKAGLLRSASLTGDYVNSFVSGLYGSAQLGFLNGIGEVFRSIEKFIDINDLSNHSFKDIVYKIELITEDVLDNWLSVIPDEWFVDKKNQIGHYKQFILNQKNIVRYIIQTMANRRAFTNFRGGALQWKELRAGTV